jgi:hypothetical protein
MGFAADELSIARIPLQGGQYQDDAVRLAFFENLIARLETTGGIDAATPVVIAPFSGTGGWTATYTADGQSEGEAAANPGLNLETVLPNYFRTFGVPIRRGRAFTFGDRADSPPVAIVSDRLAARAWPDENPIGKRLKFGGPTSPRPWMTVVGVVPETRYRDLTAPMPTLYVPALQAGPTPGVLAVRSTAPPRSVAAAVRQAVRDVDPKERVQDLSTMEALLAEPLARPRFTAMPLSGLALIALAGATRRPVRDQPRRSWRDRGRRRAAHDNVRAGVLHPAPSGYDGRSVAGAARGVSTGVPLRDRGRRPKSRS